MVQADKDKIYVPENIAMEDLNVKLDSLMNIVNDEVSYLKCTVCRKLPKG